MIASCDLMGNIGYEGKLLFTDDEDMMMFRLYTTGHHVLMGRRTYEEIRDLRAKSKVGLSNGLLVDRKCYVLSKTKESGPVAGIPNTWFVSSWQDAYPMDNDVDLWIIGGKTLFNRYVPMVDEFYLNIFKDLALKADTAVDFNTILQYLSPVSTVDAKKMFKILLKRRTKIAGL